MLSVVMDEGLRGSSVPPNGAVPAVPASMERDSRAGRISRCRVEMEKEKDSEEEGGGGVSQRGAECGQARKILIGAVRVAPRPAAGIDGAGRGVSGEGHGAGEEKGVVAQGQGPTE